MLASEHRARIVGIANKRFHGYRYHLELGQINQADKTKLYGKHCQRILSCKYLNVYSLAKRE